MMTDTPMTPRLGLPLLAAGQAQKEITHNEALVLIDSLIGAVVEGAGTAAPPTDPAVGQCWAVGDAPTGGWAGMAGSLACWTAGGWRFCTVPEGYPVRLAGGGAIVRRTASGWVSTSTVAAPSGGTTIDVECRAVLEQLRVAMAANGLISGT